MKNTMIWHNITFNIISYTMKADMFGNRFGFGFSGGVSGPNMS